MRIRISYGEFAGTRGKVVAKKGEWVTVLVKGKHLDFLLCYARNEVVRV
jgi:hypothetical protein